MIAEQCEPVARGVALNAACPTCGHTMAAHTVDYRCDICDVLLTLLLAMPRPRPMRAVE